MFTVTRTSVRSMAVAKQTYAVGRFTLEPRRQLLDAGRPVALGGKALDLLSVLAEAQGALVTKDELMAAVWPDVIIEENAIQVHMSALRKALGEESVLLHTVRGLGYRLTSTKVAGAGAQQPPRVPTVPKGPLLAVLAFENQSNDPDLDYFAEGVSEDVIQAVSCIRGVRVIAKTSSFQFSGEQRRTKDVAAALAVTHILDGSVRRQGDRVRIGSQLIDVASETILWSHRYDGDVSDVFAVQDSIARAVASALRLSIMPAARKALVPSKAFDLYLRGRRLAVMAQTREQGIKCLEAALAIAPDYADAWSSLALARALAARWDKSAVPFSVQREAASFAANRALAIDAFSGPARVALSVLEPLGNYHDRESHLLDVISLGASDPETLRQYAEFAFTVGRIDEAFEYAERSWRSDPLNEMAVGLYAALLCYAGWPEESFATYALARERWPDTWMFLSDPVLHAATAGQWSVVDDLLAEHGAERPELALARYFARVRRGPDDRHRTEQLNFAAKCLEKKGGVDPSNLIMLYELGLHDEVFALVGRSNYNQFFVADGQRRDAIGFYEGLIFIPLNRAMRRDRRFVTLCGKLGLCDYWIETGRWPDCADQVSDSYDFREAAAAFLRERQEH